LFDWVGTGHRIDIWIGSRYAGAAYEGHQTDGTGNQSASARTSLHRRLLRLPCINAAILRFGNRSDERMLCPALEGHPFQAFGTHIAYLLRTRNNFSLPASKFRGANPTVHTVSPWGRFAWWFVVLWLSPFASSCRWQRRLAPVLTPSLRPHLPTRRYRPMGGFPPARP
jgi:hypothetical protein